MSCCSTCYSSGHFAINQCCYIRRGHTTAAARATGTVVGSAWRCSARHQRYTVATQIHNSPTNFTCISVTANHTRWTASDFGCCTGHLWSPVKSGPCLVLLMLCKIELRMYWQPILRAVCYLCDQQGYLAKSSRVLEKVRMLNQAECAV